MPTESRAAKQARAKRTLDLLARAYPDAKIALEFRTPFELLVATILSAQCTDERVNMVTPALFRKYPTARELSKALVERHGGEVPETLEALVELPGVGLKTANVIIGNAFGGQALAVDTHVFRVSQRLGLARSDDPNEIHDQLVALLPRESLTLATHLMITHGRRTCVARKPACPVCPVRALCPWPDKTGAPARRA